MQSKEEIEKSYETVDPWNYQNSEQDKNRKYLIIQICKIFGIYLTALDLGAGEAWISRDMPALRKFGFEISDNAAARFPPSVERVTEIKGKYDLILSTGTLYGHYDWKYFVSVINENASNIVVISYIDQWEHKPAIEAIKHKQIFTATFPYNEYNQRVRVYRA